MLCRPRLISLSRKCPIKVWWSFSFLFFDITKLTLNFVRKASSLRKTHSPTTLLYELCLSLLAPLVHQLGLFMRSRDWAKVQRLRTKLRSSAAMKIREMPRQLLALIYSIVRLSTLLPRVVFFSLFSVGRKGKKREKKESWIKCQKGREKSEKKKVLTIFALFSRFTKKKEFLIFQGVRV